jgi:hypothetical protein
MLEADPVTLPEDDAREAGAVLVVAVVVVVLVTSGHGTSFRRPGKVFW